MPDVNVLVYAHREHEARHGSARAWVEAMASGPEPFALSVLVAVGFVRIVTQPRIFPTPTPIALGLAAIDAMLGMSNCRVLAPGPRHWALVSTLCRSRGATGKLVADAQHAAMAIEHGCVWVSHDRDFAGFEPDGLRWTYLEC